MIVSLHFVFLWKIGRRKTTFWMLHWAFSTGFLLLFLIGKIKALFFIVIPWFWWFCTSFSAAQAHRSCPIFRHYIRSISLSINVWRTWNCLKSFHSRFQVLFKIFNLYPSYSNRSREKWTFRGRAADCLLRLLQQLQLWKESDFC